DVKKLRERIAALRETEMSDGEIIGKFGLGQWDIAKARAQLRADQNWEHAFIKCLYRPFDNRSCYFSAAVMDRPRRELLDHVAGRKNLCLGLGRQGLAVNDPQWSLAAIATIPID